MSQDPLAVGLSITFYYADGTAASRQWNPDPETAEACAALLGEPVSSAVIDASNVLDLALELKARTPFVYRDGAEP